MNPCITSLLTSVVADAAMMVVMSCAVLSVLGCWVRDVSLCQTRLLSPSYLYGLDTTTLTHKIDLAARAHTSTSAQLQSNC